MVVRLCMFACVSCCFRIAFCCFYGLGVYSFVSVLAGSSVRRFVCLSVCLFVGVFVCLFCRCVLVWSLCVQLCVLLFSYVALLF